MISCGGGWSATGHTDDVTVERPPVLASAVSRWWDEPWSRGGWSLLGVGATPNTRRQLGMPIGSRVVVAGEATHPDQAGMTHGAYEEGLRAARWCIDQRHRRVVVVGAGIAGLGAARTLYDNGLDVTVVEARDRIGGRIHSVVLGDVVVELGANWLQQGNRNSIAHEAERLGLVTVPTDFGNPRDFGVAGPIEPADPSIINGLRRYLTTADPNRSIADAVAAWMADRPTWPADVVDRVVDGEIVLDSGAPLDELSGRYALEAGVGGGDRWIVGGYRQVLDDLAVGIDVQLGWPVDRIASGPDEVQLCGADRTMVADATIVTVPVATLRVGSITFDPPLPLTYQMALSRLTVGRVEKVAMRFADRWWPVSRSGYLRIFGAARREVSEWLDLTDTVGAPVVVGLFVGEWAARLWEGRTDAEITHVACEVLACATDDS